MTNKEKLMISTENRLKVVWAIIDSTSKKRMSVKASEILALKKDLGKFMRNAAEFSEEQISRIDKTNIISEEQISKIDGMIDD